MIYQFKIKLRGITKPPVWRRVQVPSHFTFDDMHEVIQAAFGWESEHLYHFADRPYSRNLYISLPNEYDGDNKPIHSRKFTLHDYFGAGHEKICYVYDFGDDWTHDIVLEECIDETRTFATCIAGKGACPEEDCGGAWGYEEMKENGEVENPNYFDLIEADDAVRAIRGPRLLRPQWGKKAPKRIFSKQWMMHMPYKIVSDIDTYYTDIANKVYKILDEYSKDLEDVCIDSDNCTDMAILLTVWFMDVVSEGGMWPTFTAECKRRYGRFLPFYEFDENDYYPDEVNEVDVRFLLWHYIQTLHDKESVIIPQNDFVRTMASRIYEIYDREFEKAPINDQWHDAFNPKSLDEPLLYSFRDYLYKTIDCNFLDILLPDIIFGEMEEIEDNDEAEGFKREMKFDLVSQMLFEGANNFLGLSPAEWGVRLLRRSLPDTAERLETMETLSTRVFKLADRDNDSLYLQDVANMDEEPDVRYKIGKDCLAACNEEAYIPETTYIVCRLTRIEDTWSLNGVLSAMQKESYERRKDLAEMTKSLRHADMRRSYENFMKASGGKEFLFFKKRKDAANFFKQALNKEPEISEESDDCTMITATPIHGCVSLIGGARLLKSKDNPCYDEEMARKEAFLIMAGKTDTPYDVVCRMYDCGMLDDASLFVANDYECGRSLVKKNAQFLMDYFLHGCRDNG